MNRYSPERKAAILKKLLPPLSLSVMELARQESISNVTLYTWRKQAKARGEVVPRSGKVPDAWPAEAKLAVVIETAALSEAELSQYCRKKGLYPEQVKAWRQACITGQQSALALKQTEREQTWADKKRIRELERELRRKDQALAETAALLVLRKKLNARYGGEPTLIALIEETTTGTIDPAPRAAATGRMDQPSHSIRRAQSASLRRSGINAAHTAALETRYRG